MTKEPRSIVMNQVETSTRIYKLISLDDSWAPWTYQIDTLVKDGKDYGYQGLPCLIGSSNFISLTDAQARFNELAVKDSVP